MRLSSPLLLPLSLLLAACPGEKDDTGGTATDDTGTTGTMEVNTEAGAIAELEAEVASYMGWSRASGWEGVVATPGGMHGESVQIWYDDIAMGSLDAPAVGATAFKEGYTDAAGTKLAALTAMRNTQDVGWIYAMWSPDGVLMDSGRADMCVGCHEADTSQSAFLAAGAM